MADVKYLLIGGGLASFHCAKNLRRTEVAAVGPQHLGGDAFGLGRTLHSQRQDRALNRFIIGVRWLWAGGNSGTLRHRSRQAGLGYREGRGARGL